MAKRKRAASTRKKAKSPAKRRLDQKSTFALKDNKLEQLLRSGKDAPLLEQYFGEQNYQELRELTAEADRAAVRGGPRVLLLHGIMGSKLGAPRPLFDDVIWIDPFDIARGNLVKLALRGRPSRVRSLGVIPFAYLKLKLRLQIAGFDVDYYHYDWRQSLDELGRQLAEAVRRDSGREVSLVAHSMGGLVSRAALAHHGAKIKRLVMLGAPNHGSFMPIQALRGTHSIVRKLGALDLRHTPEQLASRVFTTLPGLYQMLPFPEKFSQLDLYDVNAWPAAGPRPTAALLDQAKRVQKTLHVGDARCALIAGVNQETVVGTSIAGNEFVYQTSLDGDGTVPLELAMLSGVTTYYAEETHGALPNNRVVTRAAIDLLNTGQTAVLPTQRPAPRRAATRTVRDCELLTPPEFEGRTVKELTHAQLRELLDEVVSAKSHEAEAAPAYAAEEPIPPFEGVVVSRRRQHRIDVGLANGSVTDLSTRALVLGMFRGVKPSGPARALDLQLEGAISEFVDRRMFSANVGEIMILPSNRHAIRAELVVLAGLGAFDQFNESVLRLVAENIIRSLLKTHIDEFATVLIGAGSGQPVAGALESLIDGFVRGLITSDIGHRFRKVTICELDVDRYRQIKENLYRLLSTELFNDVQVTLDEIRMPAPMPPPAVPRRLERGPDPAYLIVREEPGADSGRQFRAGLLAPGDRAALASGVQPYDRGKLDKHLRRIEQPAFTLATLEDFGRQLAGLVLPENVRADLSAAKDNHLVIVNDAASSRIPWETANINSWFPAVGAGLSRRYLADNLSAAAWLDRRQKESTLDVLLVVNPTEDLPGAEEEGQRVRVLFGGNPAVRITEFHGPDATRDVLLREFSSEKYDVVHYAGHAFFDPNSPSRSGILCAGRRVLSGRDLVGIGNLPSMVFFNACEAARVRKPADRQKEELEVAARIERNVGLAEAFLRGGVANYVGTYWPVGDAPAKSFAQTFYTKLLAGETIGKALAAARNAVRKTPSVDWADYILYGNHEFRLKLPRA